MIIILRPVSFSLLFLQLIWVTKALQQVRKAGKTDWTANKKYSASSQLFLYIFAFNNSLRRSIDCYCYKYKFSFWFPWTILLYFYFPYTLCIFLHTNFTHFVDDPLGITVIVVTNKESDIQFFV